MWISRLVVVGGLALLSACSQSTHDDDVLLSGDAPVAKDAKYPDFSKPLTSAMDQMSNEDAKNMEAQLAGLGAKRRSGAMTEAEYWREVNAMRKLKAEMPTQPKS
jgi:hypothetical protein